MIRLMLVVLVFSISSNSLAHHSRANFDNETTVQITGTVLDYAWRNPHVYMEIEGDDATGASRTWLLEAHSITGLRGRGWDGDSLLEGEMVTFSGYPDRNPSKYFVLLDYIQKADGSRLYAFRDGNAEQEEPLITASDDFTGTWTLDFTNYNLGAAGGGPPTDWSYTDKARVEAEDFSVNDNPELNCLAIGVPKLVIYPYGTNWTRDENSIRIQKEHLNENRVIWFDRDALGLQNQPPSYLGSSYGYFESERHLVVETSGFLPTIWGNANGVDSSDQKTVVEHYLLSDDGMSMEVSYTVTDLRYLTESGTKTGAYLKALDREFEEIVCDPRAATRHLSVE